MIIIIILIWQNIKFFSMGRLCKMGLGNHMMIFIIIMIICPLVNITLNTDFMMGMGDITPTITILMWIQMKSLILILLPIKRLLREILITYDGIFMIQVTMIIINLYGFMIMG